MRNDAFFFLGIFLFIFVVWVATGGPTRPISFSGPYLKPITAPGIRAEAYGEGRTYDPDTPRGSVGAGIEGSIGGIRDSIAELRDQAAHLNALEETSPYKGLVTISRSKGGVAENFANREYITIQATSKAKEGVAITGWRLESGATNSAGVIPSGAAVPRSGSVNATAPIVLSRGEKAIINSGRSPIGVSFRENTCIGYFEQYQNFYPSISARSCPDPAKDFDAYYPGNPRSDAGDECLEYVEDVFDRCEMATSTPRGFTSSCKSFISTYVNYNGCVLAHGADKNFAGRTWRIFLGERTQLWKSERDTIKLLDREGKIVDVFAY